MPEMEESRQCHDGPVWLKTSGPLWVKTRWTRLGENAWPSMGGNTWTSIARKMTRRGDGIAGPRDGV